MHYRSGYANSPEVEGVIGPSAWAFAHGPVFGKGPTGSAAPPLAAALAPTVLGLAEGAGLHNSSSHHFADPVPQVELEQVLGTLALEWC